VGASCDRYMARFCHQRAQTQRSDTHKDAKLGRCSRSTRRRIWSDAVDEETRLALQRSSRRASLFWITQAAMYRACLSLHATAIACALCISHPRGTVRPAQKGRIRCSDSDEFGERNWPPSVFQRLRSLQGIGYTATPTLTLECEGTGLAQTR
jgi:hypothetical protein